jgi:sporulation protein YlmC with PRC-barrel domain
MFRYIIDYSHLFLFFFFRFGQISRILKYYGENIMSGCFEMKIGKLNGMNVITSDAYTLGEVDGAHADINTWNITHLDIDLTKEATLELGFKKPFLGSLTVCLPITAVKKVGDVITLNKTLMDLKNLKECKIG